MRMYWYCRTPAIVTLNNRVNLLAGQSFIWASEKIFSVQENLCMFNRMTVLCCCTLEDVWFIYTYLSHRCLNTQSGHKRNEILMRWGKRKGKNAFELQLCTLSTHLNHWRRSLFSGWLLDKHFIWNGSGCFSNLNLALCCSHASLYTN